MDVTLATAAGDGGGFLRWLLGLRQIDPTDPTVHLSWQYPLPGWAWLLIGVAIAAAAWVGYRKMLGARGGRVTLAAVRTVALIALAVLLARPMLVLPQETVEQDHVLMLVDRSASMSLRDVEVADGGDRISREQQLQSMLDTGGEAWDEIGERSQLRWLGFGDTLRELSGPDDLGEPDRPATAMATAIRDALRRSAGRPISGIVVWSDGRSSEPVGAETWRMLEQLGVPAYTVALGAEDPPDDVSIARVDAPERAFVDDVVPVRVIVSRLPAAEIGAPAPPGTRLQLIDTATGDVLDEAEVATLGEPVQLMTSRGEAGRAEWEVRLESDVPPLIEDNNRQAIELALVDRPIRVLYVEGYPRWEYRYLKNTLLRENSVESSIMLISADREFAQEGDVPLRRLPRDREEIDPYDVIIIGDVPATFFSSDQHRLIIEQVADYGAGVLWIGGEDDTPHTYGETPLASLLPMASSPSLSSLSGPIDLQPTPAAEGLGVLRFRWPEMSEGDTLWPESLPALMWAQSMGELKPAVEVLAADANSAEPLVARMRYGAGQSVYVGTDEIWRWRYGRGELYPEQFWMQNIRMLARGRLELEGDDPRAQLAVSHRRIGQGETIVVETRLQDQRLLAAEPDTVEVTVRDADAGGGAIQQLTLTRGDRAGHFRATWTPSTPGQMELAVTSDALADLGLSQTVQVDRDDDELRDPRSDHELLAELSQRTGGRMLTEADLSDLPRELPSRARHTAADITEPLWHSPLAFGLLMLLLTGEWVGRRLMGLA